MSVLLNYGLHFQNKLCFTCNAKCDTMSLQNPEAGIRKKKHSFAGVYQCNPVSCVTLKKKKKNITNRQYKLKILWLLFMFLKRTFKSSLCTGAEKTWERSRVNHCCCRTDNVFEHLEQSALDNVSPITFSYEELQCQSWKRPCIFQTNCTSSTLNRVSFSVI